MSITRFTVDIDRTGFTVEDLSAFSARDLKILMDALPKAVKEVRKEDRRRRVCKKLMELEGKDNWTAKESIFYACYSPKRDSFDVACDRFNLFKELEVSGL